jgi:cytochrome c553
MIPTSSQRSRPWPPASLCSLAVVALAASAVIGGAGAVAADAVAGKRKAEGFAGCHGENGVSEITKALRDYKSGLRSGGGVAAMAEGAYPLSDDEIAALAHYLARL